MPCRTSVVVMCPLTAAILGAHLAVTLTRSGFWAASTTPTRAGLEQAASTRSETTGSTCGTRLRGANGSALPRLTPASATVHLQISAPFWCVYTAKVNETDEALMSRYQHGDVRAFELLLARHRKPVFNFILRFVGNRERAEDLLQETFLRVIKGGCSY